MTAWEVDRNAVPTRGLGRTYAEGRAAMHTALQEGGSETFHEWRKRAKDLRHQLEFLSWIWPGVLPAVAHDVNWLTDLLREANDLTLLSAMLHSEPASADERGNAAVLRRLTERQHALWHDALRAWSRLYAEKAGAFSSRMEAYWSASRAS